MWTSVYRLKRKAVTIYRYGSRKQQVLQPAPRLGEAAGAEPEDTDRADFLAELSAYYIQTRYPEEIESPGAR